MYLFNADQCQTALGKQQRHLTTIEACDYCENTGKDIFNKSKACPFCFGGLFKLKTYEVARPQKANTL